jgi:hypothetical protein
VTFFIFYISKALENALEKAPGEEGGVGCAVGTNTGPGEGGSIRGTCVPPKETKFGFLGI